MKKMISSFGSAVLSREQMKGVKGGTEDVAGDGEAAKCSTNCSISGTCSPSPTGNKSCECTTVGGGTCTYS